MVWDWFVHEGEHPDVTMRAQHGFKTPDAIQIGTAVACGADYIVTADRKWKRFDAIPVLLVEEL